MLNARVLKKTENNVLTSIHVRGDTMREAIIAIIFFILVGTSFAITMPSEEECAKEVDTALKNIEKGRKNLAGMDYTSGGSCYANRKDYQKAAELFLNAAQLFVEINDSGGASASYQNTGDMFIELNDTETAKKYYLLSIDYSKKMPKGEIFIADVYKKLEDSENACKYCRLAKVDYCEKYKYCVGSSTNVLGSSEGDLSSDNSSMVLVIGVVVVLIVVTAVFVISKKKKK
jgi:hypothetical protein